MFDNDPGKSAEDNMSDALAEGLGCLVALALIAIGAVALIVKVVLL